MKKQFNLKIIFIIVLFVVFIFLFPHKVVLANPEVKDINFKLTCYSDQDTNYQSLGTGLTTENFTTNSTYNWYEYNYNGENYVVLAAATEELLSEWGGEAKSHIHYFKYYDTIQFKFEDGNADPNVYKGIILDSCGASMNVAEGEPQILDVYITGTSSDCENSDLNQKIVYVSDTGTFSTKAGTKSSVAKGNFFLKVLTQINSVIGDLVQIVMNYSGVGFGSKLTYTRNDLETDGSLNSEIQVNVPHAEITTHTTKTVNISNIVDNRNGKKETVYTTSTEIPVIPVDLYSSSINKVDLFDLDFYNKTNSNPNKIWRFIRGIVSAVSHSVLYISAALLITMLIWRSILFVSSSLGDNPAGAFESRKMMDSWLKSIILIVGVYVVMTLMLYFYQLIVNIITNGNDSNYLIRVNVENVYSFNTNLIGYLKYMTLSANDLSAYGYSILYLLMVIVDLIWFFVMFARMLIIGGLTIIAPITSVMAMTGREPQGSSGIKNILHFKNWLKMYLVWMWVPLVIVMIQKFLLSI